LSSGNAPTDEIQDGTFRDLKPTSFREYAKSSLEFHKANVKPATYDSYRSVVNGHLVPAFGDHSLSAIARPSLRQFTANLLDSGRSAETARNVLTILRKILESALEDGYLRVNPAHKCQVVLADDVVAIEHAARHVPCHRHCDALRDPSAHRVPGGSATQVMEQLVGGSGGLAGGGPRLPEISHGLTVTVEHERSYPDIAVLL
jgi:hypothetical protein